MTQIKLILMSTLVFPFTEKKNNSGQMDRLPKILSRLASRLNSNNPLFYISVTGIKLFDNDTHKEVFC